MTFTEDENDISYDYNIEESLKIFSWNELVPILIVYGITFFLGLAGNSLIVFTTYRYRRMQSATNVLLSSLASADLLLIIFCIPVKVAKLFSYTWTMGNFLCKYVHYMQNVSTLCSVLTLTSISIERYYAIVHPMKAKYICTISQARRIILVTWLLAFFLAIPILFAQVLEPVGNRVKAFWCVRTSSNEILARFQEVYMLVLVLIAPTTIMTFAYITICWEVWRVMEQRSVMTSRHALNRSHSVSKNRKEDCGENIKLTIISSNHRSSDKISRCKDESKIVKQVIYMLVAVVVLFVLCWAPVLIDNVLTSYKMLPSQHQGFLKHMRTAFHLMAYFNSCINPIIYGFMSKSFRESFQAALCCTRAVTSITGRSRKLANGSIRQLSRTGSQTRNTSIR